MLMLCISWFLRCVSRAPRLTPGIRSCSRPISSVQGLDTALSLQSSTSHVSLQGFPSSSRLADPPGVARGMLAQTQLRSKQHNYHWIQLSTNTSRTLLVRSATSQYTGANSVEQVAGDPDPPYVIT
jgi:hypothetical protein